MTTAILIPARYSSTRFPAKPLADLIGFVEQLCRMVIIIWEFTGTIENLKLCGLHLPSFQKKK
jgi:hypothetical protein